MDSIAQPDLAAWGRHLLAVATPNATHDVSLGAGALDAPVRASVIDPAAPWRLPAAMPTREVALWWARVEPSINVDAVLGDRRDGPIFEQGMYRAIEVWTDADLSAVHALAVLANDRRRADWQERVQAAVRWHLEHTQPDNATNRPWALHVFLQAETADGRLYAETLLHNCQAMSGRPDPLSAWILIDAARQLETPGATG